MIRAVRGTALAVLCTSAAALGEFALNEELHVKLKPFDELSDRHVSRMGEKALQMKIDWQHGESDSFVFHIEKGFFPNQLAYAAERFYANCKEHLKIADDRFERKCHIYVFMNEEAWREFTKDVRLDAWTGGFCTGRELFLKSRPHFRFQNTILPHEITHLVLHRFVGGDIPLWLSEGLAEFEGIRMHRLYLKARRYTLAGVPERVERNRYIPLKDLTAAIDYPNSPEAVETFYIQSERLVNFLYYQHGGAEPLIKFTTLQSRGQKFETAWNEVYGNQYRDIDAFEQKFINSVTKQSD